MTGLALSPFDELVGLGLSDSLLLSAGLAVECYVLLVSGRVLFLNPSQGSHQRAFVAGFIVGSVVFLITLLSMLVALGFPYFLV
jgi:hypothetical protein